MLKIKGSVDKNKVVANLIQHANNDKSIASSKIFKAVVTAAMISTFSNPIFAETIKDANLSDFNKTATTQVQSKTASLPSTLFKNLNSLSQVKVMSFSGKNISGQGSVSISLLDSRFPSSDVSSMMVDDYLRAIDNMSERDLIGNYKTWLSMKMSISNLILAAKDGFPSETEQRATVQLDSMKARLKHVEKVARDGSSEEISALRDIIKDEGMGMIPGANALEPYRAGFAYAMSIQGACSVIYNKDFLVNYNANDLSRGDGSLAYGSKRELFESFIINHEFSHCETQNSKFIKDQTDLAAKGLGKIKSSSSYASLNKEQALLLSVFSVSYNEYISEFYADVLGLSRTIKENNLSSSEASMLVNDIIDIRHTVGVKGDLVHATGSLLEKVKRHYDREGMPFGYDLDGDDTDVRMAKMMSSFSKLPFNDAIKNFTMISSAMNVGNYSFKDETITPKMGSHNVDHKPIAKLLYISSFDIANYTSGLRSALNKFSVGDDNEKIDNVVKKYEGRLTSDLVQEKKFMSLDY